MNRVWIVEYPGSMFQKFTGKKYAHSAMLVEREKKDLVYKCELTLDKAGDDYKIIKINREIIDIYMDLVKEKAELYLVPKKFTDNKIEKIINFWENNKKNNYSIGKLLQMTNTKWVLKKAKKYYKKTGKIWQPGWIMKKNVCSVAVDLALKKGGYDVYPQYSEYILPPGSFAKKLKKYRV